MPERDLDACASLGGGGAVNATVTQKRGAVRHFKLYHRQLILSFTFPVCENAFVLATVFVRPAAHLEIAMSTKRPGFHTRQLSNFTMQVRPLGDAELMLVQNAMAEIAPEWSVELHGICADEATLVLLPEGGDDARGPSFLISRETYGFRLDQVHWDVLTEFGVFASLDAAVTTLSARLIHFCDMTIPTSVTIH
jgi:hypothetical protein